MYFYENTEYKTEILALQDTLLQNFSKV